MECEVNLQRVRELESTCRWVDNSLNFKRPNIMMGQLTGRLREKKQTFCRLVVRGWGLVTIHQTLVLEGSVFQGSTCSSPYPVVWLKVSMNRGDRDIPLLSMEERRLIPLRGHEWCHNCGRAGVGSILNPGQLDTPGSRLTFRDTTTG